MFLSNNIFHIKNEEFHIKFYINLRMFRKIFGAFLIHLILWIVLVFICIGNFFTFTPVETHYHCKRRYIAADFTVDNQNILWNVFFWTILSLCFAIQVSNAVMGGLIYFNERNNRNRQCLSCNILLGFTKK